MSSTEPPPGDIIGSEGKLPTRTTCTDNITFRNRGIRADDWKGRNVVYCEARYDCSSCTAQRGSSSSTVYKLIDEMRLLEARSITACECERSIYAASAPALSRKHALLMSELVSRVGRQAAGDCDEQLADCHYFFFSGPHEGPQLLRLSIL